MYKCIIIMYLLYLCQSSKTGKFSIKISMLFKWIVVTKAYFHCCFATEVFLQCLYNRFAAQLLFLDHGNPVRATQKKV